MFRAGGVSMMTKSYRSRTPVSRSLSMNSRRGAVNSTSAADSMMSEGSTSPYSVEAMASSMVQVPLNTS